MSAASCVLVAAGAVVVVVAVYAVVDGVREFRADGAS